ncbi:bifunctional DNA primase/polymerase [Geodermatophilus marinus]|uniref:bifunctional DNA primase/polymerase n=1 Tax=Geodermatophilus sp. LHW52908 TaxID=2303986 RepID=UPI0013143B2F|nr:bifunctional DNA primase/polymerase [Geodermatophilus sp. LHW52908]
MTPTHSAALRAALDYAAHGWPVLPLARATDGRCSCGWPADRCTSPGKHPTNPGGCRNATTDPDTIHGWWRRWPTANVGIATGPASGLAVLDVDGEPGRDSLADLEAAHGALPGTVTALTARGCHLLYRWPGGLGNGAGTYGRGLDHRGDGGYIVAPPSVHPTGHVYQWLTADGSDPRPWAHPLPDWPAHVLRTGARAAAPRPVVVPLHRPGDGPLAGLVRVVLNAQPGTRNNAVNWASYRAGEHIARGRLAPEAAASALLAAAAAVGLPEHEAVRTIASGLRSAGAA